MRLSVIVPIYNEEKTVRQILSKVLRQKEVDEVIVVNDCSTDATDKILHQIHSRKLKVFRHQSNMGKGSAIRTGIAKAHGQYILIQDADLEYDPSDYPRLLAASSPTTVVYGSRLTHHNPMAYLRTYLGNVLLTRWCNLLFGTHLTDAYTCYKLLPRSIVRNLRLRSQRFELEAEITGKLARRGIAITEIPIHYIPRTYGSGKKIKAKDALIGALTLLDIRLHG